MKHSVLFWLLVTPGCSFVPSPLVASKSTPITSSSSFYQMRPDDFNENSNSAFNNLSVSELKRLLGERGIDFRDCLEKYELIQRLQESSPAFRTVSPPVDPLTAHERGIIQTFKKASPSVAYVQTTSKAFARKGLAIRGLEIPAGTGSGFLWDNQGHVVTNYHVVAGRGGGGMPSRVTVKLSGMARAMEAEVVGAEPEKDLAVLRVKDTYNLPDPIDVGTSSDLQVGQSVLAIGNPYGLDDTLTTGVVSALGRDLDGVGGRPIRGCIQTDASINPGNSGGPLLDSRGRLIGVNTAIFSPGGMAGNIGIGFAIPVDTVTRVVNQIIRYGKTVRPTLGITVVNDGVVKALEKQYGRGLDGVLIAEIVPNSPAVVAGLEATRRDADGSIELGDLISRIDGNPVKCTEDLISAIEEKQDGDVVELVVWRKCNPRRVETIRVQLTTREKLDQPPKSSSYSSGPLNRRSNGRGRSRNALVSPFSPFWQ
ncbi:Probable periplasmic serine endoprotease DegP-like [Seminavis robusta]|uniref:Probable periplasmic serine endoprotease DegP-like n=1 Tax=Seminavis robusta TaxID=568900 RepID=A0A9N8HGI7_9STRA|nr:Probable periplasmic serine endoprotease DegP-like [Seminavis robusta]|eukprot:Sro400_g134980.1 Probable periplasmic serine endoprotease DegP-like (482) ;mRNA; f:3750-5414